jgi:pyruvate dehydrogenase E1 component alpha subunit/2-oxoisovalerate dehydrogenase E1 component alpha subunit
MTPTTASPATPAAPPHGLSRAQLHELYYYMRLTRSLEERLVNLYRQTKVIGGLFRSLGQEADSVGSAYALDRTRGDFLSPLIRNLGSMLVQGAKPLEILRQYMAKAESPTRGRELNIHYGDLERGFIGQISHLGDMVPVMAGVALSFKMRKQPRVGLVYVGDGAMSTGAFHEGINFAAVQKLPVVVVLEYNRYSYSTPSEMQCGAATLADKAAGYGVASAIVDGNDVLAVVEAARRAVAWAREGNGPFLLECKTYRRKGHAEHDGQAYVDVEELAEWTRRDPIGRFERQLDEGGVMDAAAREAARAEIDTELDTAVAEAEASPAPVPDPEFRGVRADEEAVVRRRGETFVGGLG